MTQCKYSTKDRACSTLAYYRCILEEGHKENHYSKSFEDSSSYTFSPVVEWDIFPDEYAERDKAAKYDSMLETIALLEQWTHTFGKSLIPPGADTYGEGMRDAKDQVAVILHGFIGRR